MESSLGLPPDTLLDVFDSFDTKPLASGSIAQVHKAHSGWKNCCGQGQTSECCKSYRYGFQTHADRNQALSWMHVRETVKQFSPSMAAQAHFNVEAHNLEVLNFNFRHWNHVKFPNPIYATSAVIIKTFESGQIITTILDKFDALATQIALEQGTLDCRGGRRMSWLTGYMIYMPSNRHERMS
jgi:aarF domain-containing kinase